MSLERLPACATTGVGSLPFAEPGEAVRHVFANYDVPFCPQLPALDGDMVSEWLGSDPGRCGWARERDRERPRAWDAFARALDSTPPEHGVVKLQVTGPLTLALALERARDDRKAAIDLAGEVSAWLAATAAAQVEVLAGLGLSVLLMVDEPSLETLALDPEPASRAWDPLRAVAPHWGLHVCCRPPWDVIGHARPDVLSWDLAAAGSIDRAAALALQALLDRGSRIAWGVARVDSEDGPAQAAAHLYEPLRALRARGADPAGLLERSLLTPSCGTARATRDRERRLADALWAVSGAGRAWPASERALATAGG